MERPSGSGKRMSRFAGFLILIVFPPVLASASIPAKINYQGYLTDSSGNPIQGTLTITFSLYDVQSGGTPLWSETRSVAVSNGIFSVQLGTFTSLDLPFDAPYYLGVKVGGDDAEEMTPRIALTAVGYAFRAKTVEIDRDTLNSLSCSNGQVPMWNGTSWVCGDRGGSYTAGAGLILSGNEFCADTGYLQRRVETGCSVGHSIRIIHADGTVTCETAGSGDITAVFAGSGLTGGGEGGDVTLQVHFAGSGSASTVARSDHDHSGVYAASSHTHTGEEIASGTIAESRIDPALARLSQLTAHTSNRENPHSVTAAQVGAAPLAHTHSGGDITSGTVGDGYLSPNVALLNSTQTFTGLKTFHPTSGTVPFAVDPTKTGLVTNLNADLLDGQHASAFALSSHHHDPLYVNTAGDTMTGSLNLPTNGLRVGTNQLVVSEGKVGIGTSSPNEQLEITGNLKIPVTSSTGGAIYSGDSILIHAFGSDNFFGGASAGNLEMTGYWNTGIGSSALQSNLDGSANTACGAFALSSNTTGQGNTATGFDAMNANTLGELNTATGNSALSLNEVGNHNAASGAHSLYSNTVGSYNTAVGSFSLYYNGEGNRNTALGYRAGVGNIPANANKTGSNNTFVGAFSGPGTTTQLDNATAIGYLAEVSSSNSLVLGATTPGYQVNVGIGTPTPQWMLHVNGDAAKPTGEHWTVPSDIRLKKNIQPIEGALDKMLALRGVVFEWDDPEKATLLPGLQMGMIAQEVEEVFPEWVGADRQGYKDLTLRGFEALTVEAMRQLRAENDALRATIDRLERKIGELEALLTPGR